MRFPEYRGRRARSSANMRRLISETRVSVDDLIAPLFIRYGSGVSEEIDSIRGAHRFSVDRLDGEIESIASLGIPAVLLFGIPESKDPTGSSSHAEDGPVQRAIGRIKRVAPELVVITDVCIDEYTDHGHCGLVSDGKILNDETLPILAKMALSHADAGADIVAPSDMMDGRVGAIRAALDGAGHSHVAIMSYAVKYASAFYGPFRSACDSEPAFGDRSSYQMDPANAREAMREAALDLAEGADILMVKPALVYLDIIHRIRARCDLPLAVYQVSGEFAMIDAAAARGWIDRDRAMMESLIAIRRAGADMIITYYAKEAATKLLKEGGGQLK